jgi:hypothetical protein
MVSTPEGRKVSLAVDNNGKVIAVLPLYTTH